MVGIVGWAVIVGLLLAWQGIGLIRAGDGWPTMSDMFRRITRYPPGRVLLFSVWLWIGWHLFVRGWRFFLRS